MKLKFNSNKTALIRVDFNVPMHNSKILDLNRVHAAIPTIQYCLNNKMSVVLMSHFGRPIKKNTEFSLKKLLKPLSEILNKKVLFHSDLKKDISTKNIPLQNNEVILLENLRFYSGEVNNDINFAKQLAKYGDIYINDAFAASHREHASISAVKQFFSNSKKFKGLLLSHELEQLKKLSTLNSPYTIVVGGSKIGSKIHILKNFINTADYILIGGGMSFPFIKFNGGKIGSSLCNDSEVKIVKDIYNDFKNSSTKLILPVDCVTTTDLIRKTDIKICNIKNISRSSMGVDIGPKTIQLFKSYINKSKTIMWNGPMGVSEFDEFSNGTKNIATSIVEATQKDAYSLIGGGDTVSEISKFGLKAKFSYVSTGGGAMLEYFKHNQLKTTNDLLEIIS
ncbi:MAG: phosphoglycerate kinase [Flavobacteriales bacterium]|nr:phosphoglycerate kinase [Flavobacteriales bacterium]|tara:strand:- start:5719 stop:6900 length:1182 start_codon:yes stop_codon:yes gene_type:complete